MIRSTRKKRRFDKSLETKRERERRNFREERDEREGISRYITGVTVDRIFLAAKYRGTLV